MILSSSLSSSSNIIPAAYNYDNSKKINHRRRFHSIDTLNIDEDNTEDIIPYKLDIKDEHGKQCSYTIDDDNVENYNNNNNQIDTMKVTYTPTARIMIVSVSVVW